LSQTAKSWNCTPPRRDGSSIDAVNPTRSGEVNAARHVGWLTRFRLDRGSRHVSEDFVVQLFALIYAAVSLWNGRPLYYAFSENVLQLVQAYDIDARELALARAQNAELVPHWYSLPRCIWAPLPALREQLNKVDDLGYFSAAEKKALKERMRAAGLAADQLNSMAFTGRGPPLLAVFDPQSLKMVALFKVR